MKSMNRLAWMPTGTDATARRDLTAGRRRAGRIAGAAITVLLASTLVPGAVAPASAEVDWMGPVAANGFPAFFDDGNVKLKLCDNGAAGGCIGDLTAPPAGPEAFWYNATAVSTNLTYEAVLEAAYLNGPAVRGEEIGISATRFILRGVMPGATYTITHPYGVDKVIADANGRVDVAGHGGFMCDQAPGGTCDWNAVGRGFLGDYALGVTGTFLKQVNAPAGTLGDINVASPVTGAPSGTNAVIATGPNIDGVGRNTLTITDFTVQGVTTLAPAGTPTMPKLTPTGATGNVTNTTLPTFTGTIDNFVPGTEVPVQLLVDGSVIGTTTTVNGAYSFTATTPLAAGPHSVSARNGTLVSTMRSITVAVTKTSDFNTDGLTDLVARDTVGGMWLYPGNGSGGFLTRKPIGKGWNIYSSIVSPGDVTGDGKADIVARDALGQLFVYAGNGTGGVVNRRQIGKGWNVMTAITGAGDMTGDGKADILARDKSGILWLYPMANGAFQPAKRIGTGWNIMATISGAGDFSGDGKADILARDTSGQLWLYRGNGAGAVISGSRIGTNWHTMNTLVTPGNWDRAGGTDVLARDAAGGLWLYPGNNAGVFNSSRKIGAGWTGYMIG